MKFTSLVTTFLFCRISTVDKIFDVYRVVGSTQNLFTEIVKYGLHYSRKFVPLKRAGRKMLVPLVIQRKLLCADSLNSFDIFSFFFLGGLIAPIAVHMCPRLIDDVCK